MSPSSSLNVVSSGSRVQYLYGIWIYREGYTDIQEETTDFCFHAGTTKEQKSNSSPNSIAIPEAVVLSLPHELQVRFDERPPEVTKGPFLRLRSMCRTSS